MLFEFEVGSSENSKNLAFYSKKVLILRDSFSFLPEMAGFWQNSEQKYHDFQDLPISLIESLTFGNHGFSTWRKLAQK